MRNKPLSLSDRQLAEIKAAAKTVPPDLRGDFLQGVAYLGSEPTDAAVAQAIAAQLSLGRIPAFLCDHKTVVSK
jgi:hypothetical protein